MVDCDRASTASDIGGIVQGRIDQITPLFILAVMVFSYACPGRLDRAPLDVTVDGACF